jgi:hypothetical protein
MEVHPVRCSSSTARALLYAPGLVLADSLAPFRPLEAEAPGRTITTAPSMRSNSFPPMRIFSPAFLRCTKSSSLQSPHQRPYAAFGAHSPRSVLCRREKSRFATTPRRESMRRRPVRSHVLLLVAGVVVLASQVGLWQTRARTVRRRRREPEAPRHRRHAGDVGCRRNAARTHPQAVRAARAATRASSARRLGRRLAGDSRANLITVTDEPQENKNRKDRDRERSGEAHWRVAEEGAEDQDGGPKQKTEKSQEDTRTGDR